MDKFIYPFYKISLYIIDKIVLKKLEEQIRGTEEQLGVLYHGSQKITAKEYYAKNIAVVLTILFWGCGAVLLIQVADDKEQAFLKYLERPAYGQGDQVRELEAYIEGESEKTQLSVQVSEQKYTKEEIQRVFREIMEGLEAQILGENETLDEVRSDLELPASSEDGTITMQWIVAPSEVMDHNGNLLKDVEDDGELVELKVLLKYQEHEAEYTCYAHVYPPYKSPAEKERDLLLKEVEKADEEGIHENQVQLPEKVGDKSIRWSAPGISTAAVLFFLVGFSALASWLMKKQQLEKMVRERNNQLIMDYPDLLFKLSMLLGAGLTIQGAFMKIGSEYQNKKKKRVQYVYEEVLVTCREMKNGVGEAKTYIGFGKRCGESRYIKLGSILAQNLKRGNKDLREILETESMMGMEERKNAARKLGEEAGSKLLLPMMLMLLVVLVILLIPAIMAL